MVVHSRIVFTDKPPVDDSIAHDDHVMNSKNLKFMQQKASIDATSRIGFDCLEKRIADIAIQDLLIISYYTYYSLRKRGP